MVEQIQTDLERGEVNYTVNQERLAEMYEDLDSITASQHKEFEGEEDRWPEKPFNCRLIWPQEVYGAKAGSHPSIRLVSYYMNLTEEEFAALAPHADHFELSVSNVPDKFTIEWFYTNVIEPLDT